jgi:hypothetical protein
MAPLTEEAAERTLRKFIVLWINGTANAARIMPTTIVTAISSIVKPRVEEAPRFLA